MILTGCAELPFQSLRFIDFRNPHRRFCADFIVVYVNFQGMRQPDKVYLAILVFRTFVLSNPISVLSVYDMPLVSYVSLMNNIWNFHSPLAGIRVETEVEV